MPNQYPPPLLPPLADLPIDSKQQFLNWPEQLMYPQKQPMYPPMSMPQMYMSHEDVMKQFQAYQQYYGLAGQNPMFSNFYYPGTPNQIQVATPNFININNLNAMGNAYFFPGNQQATPPQKLPHTNAVVSDKKVPANDNSIFNIQVDQEFYKKIYQTNK